MPLMRVSEARERERERASKKNGDELALAHFLRRSEATEARGEWSGGTGNDWVSWDAVGVAGMHSKAEGRAHTASRAVRTNSPPVVCRCAETPLGDTGLHKLPSAAVHPLFMMFAWDFLFGDSHPEKEI